MSIEMDDYKEFFIMETCYCEESDEVCDCGHYEPTINILCNGILPDGMQAQDVHGNWWIAEDDAWWPCRSTD